MVLLTACGTTVRQEAAHTGGVFLPGADGEAGSNAGSNLELGAPGTGGGASGQVTPGSGPGAPQFPLGHAAPRRSTAPGTTAARQPRAAEAAPKTRGPIKVGIPYAAGADEANAAAGSSATTGNPQQQWMILINEVNGRGGVAGHRVEPIFFRIDANGDFAAQSQAACSHFTEDHRVVAVLGSGINFTPASFYDCLDRAGVSVISSGGSSDRQDLAKRPLMLLANAMTLDRTVASTVEGLAAQGWLAEGARVGVVTYDEPTFRRAVAGPLRQALKQRGATLTEEQYVQFPQSTAGYGPIAAQTSNAVLRFNTERIDRVLFIEVGGEIALFFMQAAESQGYRPVYGLSSNDGGAVLAANVPKAQLRGARGIGWVPSIDVAPDHDPLTKAAGRQRCLKIFAAEGVTFSSANALAIGTTQCDLLRVLELAGARAGAMTGQGIAAGAMQLGTSFESAVTFSTAFGRDRRDGAASYRPTAFLGECECFRYVGGERPIS